jgi:hypothetical protein
MKYNFVTYLKDPDSKQHKVFKFKSLEDANTWFNKFTAISTGRVFNRRKVTFNAKGLVTSRDGAVVGMWRTC